MRFKERPYLKRTSVFQVQKRACLPECDWVCVCVSVCVWARGREIGPFDFKVCSFFCSVIDVDINIAVVVAVAVVVVVAMLRNLKGYSITSDTDSAFAWLYKKLCISIMTTKMMTTMTKMTMLMTCLNYSNQRNKPCWRWRRRDVLRMKFELMAVRNCQTPFE